MQRIRTIKCQIFNLRAEETKVKHKTDYEKHFLLSVNVSLGCSRANIATLKVKSRVFFLITKANTENNCLLLHIPQSISPSFFDLCLIFANCTFLTAVRFSTSRASMPVKYRSNKTVFHFYCLDHFHFHLQYRILFKHANLITILILHKRDKKQTPRGIDRSQ